MAFKIHRKPVPSGADYQALKSSTKPNPQWTVAGSNGDLSTSAIHGRILDSRTNCKAPANSLAPDCASTASSDHLTKTISGPMVSHTSATLPTTTSNSSPAYLNDNELQTSPAPRNSSGEELSPEDETSVFSSLLSAVPVQNSDAGHTKVSIQGDFEQNVASTPFLYDATQFQPSVRDPTYEETETEMTAHGNTLAGFTLEHENLKNPSLEAQAVASWLPFTLRLPFLTFLICASTMLGAATLSLTILSNANNGLGPDNNSSALLFGWRFTPTLVAVLYTLCTAALLLDVKRTEIFARMSRPGGASALSTVCFPSRFWWNDPLDALNKRMIGARSWVLLWASVVNIIGFLVISPLSAGLLTPVNIDVLQQTPFAFIKESPIANFPTDANDTIMLQAISGITLNISTSVWVVDDYYVKPFWRLSSEPQLGASFATNKTAQNWTAVTTAYRADLKCSPMSLKVNRTVSAVTLFDEGLCNNSSTGCSESQVQDNQNPYGYIELASDDGCSVVLVGSLYPDMFLAAGGWWAKSSSNLLRLNPDSRDLVLMSNASSGCTNRSIMSYNALWASNQSLVIKSYVCSTSYYEAQLPVTIAVSDTHTQILFDRKESQRKEQLVDSHKFNLQQLDDSFLDSNWMAHFHQSNFGGPSQAIAVQYDYDIQRLVNSESLDHDASRVMQQWFGQTMLHAQSEGANIPTTSGIASITQTERRIVVIQGIGFSISFLLLLSAVLLAVLAFQSRLRRRPLGLRMDPASIAAATSLITSNHSTRETFQGCERASDAAIRDRLQNVWFSIRDGSLRVTNLDPLQELPASQSQSKEQTGPSKDTTYSNTTPVIFRFWMGLFLLTVLLALVGAIAILYNLFQITGLHQRAMVYELDLNMVHIATTLAPFSIIPTLVAVGIKLWYGAFEGTLRRAQPFIGMSKHSKDVKHSVLVHYTSSPLIFGAFKALKHSDWILAFVFLGTLSTEICQSFATSIEWFCPSYLRDAVTVGMSALWDKEIRTTVHLIEVSRQLELRQVPAVIEGTQAPTSLHIYPDETLPVLLDAVYGNYLTGWLYGALLETMDATSSPPWSKDAWSFAPVDFSASADAIFKLSKNTTILQELPYNVTVYTPALTAFFDCKPFDVNSSSLLATLNFTDDNIWNTTNRPRSLEVGYELSNYISNLGNSMSQYILPSKGHVICCANETGGVPGEAAIGYGTAISSTNLSAEITEIVLKWIVGRPLDGAYYDNNNTSHWIWPEKPSIQSVTCKPVIQQADALVTVDLSTGTVRNYTITSEPKFAMGAWTDKDVRRSPYASVSESMLYLGSKYNTTYSYGWMFRTGLIYSGTVKNALELSSPLNVEPPQYEDDHVFNIRTKGMNVDFFSYSMLQLVKNHKQALLDATTLSDIAGQTLGIYFKHFASGQVNSITGGRAFQSIGAQLPDDFPEPENPAQTSYNQSMAVNIPRTTLAYVHVPTESLIMSQVAVFLCLSILALLCVIVVGAYVVNRNRFRILPRDVEMLASVLAYVYNSPRLLAWVSSMRETDDWRGNKMGNTLVARFGSFSSSDGQSGWGVELVDREGGTK
ncbi:hypothetical protein BP6252_13086 [Coleophoma cylindrospora]|uniref:Uncharacterized protein n=1 Tax=Coleophoma cylindrospora TaxID=1849047 RepID=A0A3D8QAB1_9HELO|nr:hypothetical protein BP6252_13086 [Coleophoma cylindrospora]